jgi:hypothetical protein
LIFRGPVDRRLDEMIAGDKASSARTVLHLAAAVRVLLGSPPRHFAASGEKTAACMTFVNIGRSGPGHDENSFKAICLLLPFERLGPAQGCSGPFLFWRAARGRRDEST